MWRSLPYRIARGQLRLPPKKGGLSLVDVEKKCCALFVSNCTKILKTVGDEFEVKFFEITRAQGKYPSYMKSSLQIFDSLYHQNPTPLESSKLMYAHLMITEGNHTPTIEITHPNWSWPIIWENISYTPLPSDWKSSLLLFINDAMGYADKLFRHNRVLSNQCPKCQQVETVMHKFCICVSIRPIWFWVCQALQVKVKLPANYMQMVKSLRFD